MRTRFKKEIITEFLPPSRKTTKQKVIILAGGMPSFPGKKILLEFFSKKGFWVFNPRYRGSWESDGKFLAKSPHQDILDVIDGIHNNFVSIWDYHTGNKTPYKLNPDQIILIGNSFGGPAVILASLDKRVHKVVAIAPVINWQKTGKSEPLPLLIKFTKEAFGNGYRLSSDGWKKISKGKFYNPIAIKDKIEGEKLFLIHAKDDDICPYAETKKFAQATGAKLISVPKGGHLGSSELMKTRFYKMLMKFIKEHDKPHHITNLKTNNKRKIKQK